MDQVQTDGLQVRAIEDITDPVLPEYLDLYETAFPETERLPVSDFLRVLADPARCGGSARLLVGVNAEDRMVSMARLDLPADLPVAYLIYLAVVPSRRGSGHGGAMLRWIADDVRHRAPDRSFVLLEVEDPAPLIGPGRLLAERRIAFYRRHDAVMLHGVRYMQRGPLSSQEVPMLLTVIPLGEVTPAAVFSSACDLFGSAVTRLPEPLELR